jgi:hypothetical protein
VATDHLQADRQAVDGSRRDRHGRAAVQVGREGEAAVVAASGRHAAERVGQRAFGGEGDVGVGRGDDEVDLLEDLGHALVDIHPPPLDLRAGRDAVALLGHAEAIAHLGRQDVLALGPEALEHAVEEHHARDRPRRAHVRQARVDAVDTLPTGVVDEGAGGVLEHLPHGRRHSGVAPVGNHGDAQAAQLVEVGVEAGFPPVDPRQAQRITRIVPVGDVAPARRIPHRPRHAPDHGRETAVGDARAAGDAAVGALEAEQPGEAGGDADRAAAVPARGDGDEAARHRRRRATGRTARGAGQVPRVARDAVQLGAGAVDAAELARRREAHQHGAGVTRPGDVRGRVRRHVVGERHRRLGVGPAGDLIELLDTDGHPAEGQRHVGASSRLPGAGRVEEGEGVELGALDGRQRGLELLDRAALAPPEGVDERAGVSRPGRVGHGRNVAVSWRA